MPDPASHTSAYRQDRLRQLRAFCFTAEAGSISRAARRLAVTQPSVSLQIQALERELGITLLERRGPRIRLTPDGEALYARFSGTASAINDVQAQLDGEALEPAAAEALWRSVRDHTHAFFSADNEPLWRLSLPPGVTMLM